MTNFDKLVFNPNWIKICSKNIANFQSDNVVLLRFCENCFHILSFPEYECDASDLIALRSSSGSRIGGFCYFMPLDQFEELYKSVMGVCFLTECEVLDEKDKHGFIRDGIGVRKEFFFGGRIKTFLIQDALDLAAMNKLESMLWK
ncbi:MULTISPECIES: hypothetical protein [Acinetobacter]|uniref:Uncharacterized protein n=1 Tax=Acinetobacter piscicola TaxID=2006115 RepID=A0A7S6VVE0_9GAMM|nr:MULTISPECIES: hypothetical protein [Acinetobacter]QOW45510.1 hypothetical protein G0028_06120 [Acinetobacter piscicola]